MLNDESSCFYFGSLKMIHLTHNSVAGLIMVHLSGVKESKQNCPLITDILRILDLNVLRISLVLLRILPRLQIMTSQRL
jgi:hypothetical protein